MRYVYHLTDFSLPPGQQQCVAKLSKDPNEQKRTYFSEVEMQYKCKELAQKFNAYNLPKRIDFVDSWVVEFPNRPAPHGAGPFTVLVEPVLRGPYVKHSNNYGFVSPENRSTPQAFSHWTWVQSGGKILVCDIQGVNDLYTDPQIHSNAGHQNYLYGRGDMGMDGINHFFATHRCNGLCRSLGLPPHTGPQAMHPAFESTAVRLRPQTPIQDIYGRSYSSASTSPASSVGGISTASCGFADFGLPRVMSCPVVADVGMAFPQLPAMPMLFAI
eukprot:EG_transcript_15428